MRSEFLKIAGVKSEAEFYKKFPSEEAFMKKHGKALKKLKAKSEGSFKAHKMYGPKGEVKTAKTLKEHLALKKKGWGHESPKAQFGKTFGSNFGNVDTDIQGLGDDALQGPSFDMLGDGSMDLGSMATFGVGAIGALKNYDEGRRQEQKVRNIAEQSYKATGVGLDASVAIANEQKKYKPNLNNFNRPEQFATSGENLLPVDGVGSTPISKTGGAYKAQRGKSTSKPHPNPMFEKHNDSLTNQYKKHTNDSTKIRKGQLLHEAIPKGEMNDEYRKAFAELLYKYGYKAQTGGTFKGEFMPIVNPNQQKQFNQGGYLKAKTGFDMSNLQWGAGEYSGIADAATNLATGNEGVSASGKFAGGALGTVGNLIAPGVGGAIGKFIGENVFDDLSGNVAATERYNKGAQRNVLGIQNNAGASTLHSGNVATRNGRSVPSYRSGGNMKGNYVSPNPSALDTMKLGGQLKTLWGGEAETVAYNPYAGGESLMFKGNSHETRDPRTAETGIGIAYGDGAMQEPEGINAESGTSSSVKKIEVEGGEPAYESTDENGEKQMNVIGDMHFLKSSLEYIGDDRAEGKKMKNFIAKDIHGDEIKANKMMLSVSKIGNDADSDTLDKSTAKIKEEASKLILKKAADTKERVALVQDMQNKIFDSLGADANKFIKTGKIVNDPMRDYNSSVSEMSKNGKIVKAQTGPPTDKPLGLNTLPDEEKVYKSAAEAEKDGYVLNKQTGKYERTVGNKVEKAELEIGANETYDRQSKTDDGLYGNVTMEIFEEAKAANPWFDWTDFDPSNKSDVKEYQNQFNKRAEEAGSDVRINPDGMFGNQTSSARFTPATEGSEPSVEIANIEDADTETTTTEQTTINPMFNALGNLLNQRKKTKDYTMDPNQLGGEIYSLISNRDEPVDARFFTPSLRSPYDISLQAQKNDAISQNRAMMRNPVFANNPAAAAMASAQTYSQLQKINEQEFIANQQMKDAVYSGNLEKIDQAKMMNLGIADQQQDRMTQGRANTRKERIDALSSIGNKQANFERDNRRNKVLANMYPTFGFDDNYQAQVETPATFNIPGQGPTGLPSIINEIFQRLPKQEETSIGKYGKKVTKNNKNSNILKALRNL